MGSKNPKPPNKKNSEIVGFCLHQEDNHFQTEITWEKARRKCIKQFNNKCKYFVPKGV
jgi:hypothetical protein